ncbi:MAG: class I SAM-dependent methyltransferase [Casimicrobiaceae bacterium]
MEEPGKTSAATADRENLQARCRICDSECEPFGSALVLNKYDVRYFSCGHCGFVQTERPYWLEEAYGSAIAPIDIGPLDRALRMAETTKALAVTFFNPWKPCLDFGAGYGLLVRRLRDLGLDFRYYDRHCANLFAQGFEATPFCGDRFELVTAFEVAEHLEDPVADFERILACTPNLFFSTEILPPHRPGPQDWWYYVPEFGQHISIFSRKSLDVMAQRLNKRLLSSGSLHLLTDKHIPAALYSLVLEPRVARRAAHCVGAWRGLGSRLARDFEKGAGTSMRS